MREPFALLGDHVIGQLDWQVTVRLGDAGRDLRGCRGDAGPAGGSHHCPVVGLLAPARRRDLLARVRPGAIQGSKTGKHQPDRHLDRLCAARGELSNLRVSPGGAVSLR